jgi:tetratricopeptide (TPR) repeat protein
MNTSSRLLVWACLVLGACQQENLQPAAPVSSLSSETALAGTATSQGQADEYNRLGIAQDLKGNYPAALSYYQKALAIRKELGLTEAMAKSYNNIAIVYKEQGKYTLATSSYTQALSLTQAGEMHTRITRNYALALRASQKYQAAKDQFTAALVYWQLVANTYWINVVRNDLREINQLLAPGIKQDASIPPVQVLGTTPPAEIPEERMQ